MGKTTGILILPPVKQDILPLIQAQIGNTKIISNTKFVATAQLVSLKTPPATQIYGDDTIYVDTKNTNLDLSHQESKYALLLMEMAKRAERLLIVAPGPITPLVFALLAGQIMEHGLQNVRMLVDSTVLTGKDLVKALQSTDQNLLKSQWSRLISKRPVAKVYAENELLKTPKGDTLRQYQQQLVDFSIANKRVGLFVDMGLGKTLAVLATLDQLVKTDQLDSTKPVLIVAPIMVALDTWSREAKKWGYDMDVKMNIHLPGNKRIDLLNSLTEPMEKLTLVTTNPAQLKSIIEYYKTRHLVPPFQAIIVDELSQFKSPTAQRFVQMQLLAKNVEYFFGLTGTPAPNNLLDIWSQLMIINPANAKSLGYNFYQYRNTFFMPDIIGHDGTVYSWKLKNDAEERIYQLMKPSVISMQSSGLIDLPDIAYNNRYVTLPPKAQKLYDKMDKELRNELLHNEDNEESVSLKLGDTLVDIPNSAVLTGKLAQLSSGALYDNLLENTAVPDDDRVNGAHYQIFHDEKLKALKDIVDTATSPVLVFFYFKSELDRMKKYIDFEYLNPHDPNVQDIITRWNDGKIPVLVAHPASTGHGLNLQDGGHIMVWLTTTWSNEQYRQSVKRLYRSGQKHPVSVIHIVAANTVDEEIIDRIDAKEVGQSRLMAALDVADRTTT